MFKVAGYVGEQFGFPMVLGGAPQEVFFIFNGMVAAGGLEVLLCGIPVDTEAYGKPTHRGIW